MTLFNRETLKNFFRKGRFPSEAHFSALIDSTINKIDDGFNKTEDNGLQVSPQGSSDSLVSFFRTIADENPKWQIGLRDNAEVEGLSFDFVKENRDGSRTEENILFLSENGEVGIKQSKPRMTLDVNGTLGIKNRMGTYALGEVDGDGQWYTIIDHLTGLQAFEILAIVEGPRNRGRYALTHAIAISAYGKSCSRIQQIKATHRKLLFWPWIWDQIDFRWSGDIYNYGLQVRTRSPYKHPEKGVSRIQYHINCLWNRDVFKAAYAKTDREEVTKEPTKE